MLEQLPLLTGQCYRKWELGVSLVIRRGVIGDTTWPRVRRKRSESRGEEIVAPSNVKALNKRGRELKRVLGNNALENAILREAVKVARKKPISRLPSSPNEGSA